LDQEPAIDALVFGYTLGSETIYKDVTSIAGGTVIYRAKEKICFDTYYQINYDEIKDNNWQWESLPNLINLFTEGLKNRIKFSTLNIVALSGGLDSRTVAAGFKHAGIESRFISFQDANGNASKDLTIAAKIAGVYQQHLEIYQLDSPTAFDFDLLFEKKAGMNSLDMSFIGPYLTYLAGLSAQPAMFTGDGGDKVFPDLTPPIPRPTIALLRNYVFYSNQKLPVAVAKKIMRNEHYSPLKKVFDLLQSYPEKTMSGKYIHFLMDNRVANWLNEGEDRNRNFIISLTPFYNLKFYKALMSVPDRYKADFTLYRKFLELLDPAIADINNANWGFPLSEKRKIHKVYLKEDMKRTRLGVLLKEALKSKKNYCHNLSETERNLFEQYASDQVTGATFDLKYATALKNFDPDNFYCLLTLMKVTTLS
jgi:asparagine synthase (glutamine-hydrolysing)